MTKITAPRATVKGNWHLLRKIDCLGTSSIDFTPTQVFLKHVIMGSKIKGLKGVHIHHRKKIIVPMSHFLVRVWISFCNANITSRGKLDVEILKLQKQAFV